MNTQLPYWFIWQRFIGWALWRYKFVLRVRRSFGARRRAFVATVITFLVLVIVFVAFAVVIVMLVLFDGNDERRGVVRSGDFRVAPSRFSSPCPECKD